MPGMSGVDPPTIVTKPRQANIAWASSIFIGDNATLCQSAIDTILDIASRAGGFAAARADCVASGIMIRVNDSTGHSPLGVVATGQKTETGRPIRRSATCGANQRGGTRHATRHELRATGAATASPMARPSSGRTAVRRTVDFLGDLLILLRMTD